MRSLITPSQMRDMEKRYFVETGTPSIDLMEQAARALCDALLRRYGAERRVYFACGPGGNGGDGLACARMYRQLGGEAAVFLSELPRSADAVENLQRARLAGVQERRLDDCPEAPDL